MNILISGATGFIGTHLRTRLLQEGHSLTVILSPKSVGFSDPSVQSFVFDGDTEKLTSYIRQGNFDGVIHLASLFLAQHNTADITGLINSNILLGTQLLETAVQANIPWFVNTGTFWQHYQNKEYLPVNLYAATKQAFEDIAKFYYETSPINFVTLKLCDTFGPDDPRPKIFNLWLKNSRGGEPLDMSPGEQIIDISYIDNVIDGYLQLIKLLAQDTNRSLCGKSFALRSDERMSLKELSLVFEQVTKTKLNINWGKKTYRPREVMVPWDKGESIPGWVPKINIQEGIRRTFHG
jgi:nucleoside-diphosphate-sugar epimerase